MTISANYPAIRPSLLLDFANTEQLDPRITFSRPTTAIYYNGYSSAVAEQNLLLYSEQFDNANWTKTNTTVTANSTVAPDGSTTADTLTADGTANTHGITQASVTSSVGKTFSIYAKAGTNNYLQLYFGGDANPWADFDLSLGTVGSTGTTVTASIVSVGSGWYRCIVTTTSTTATNIIAAIVSSSTAARGESNSLATTVILWGAQVEQRSSVTAYTPTTTIAITNYIPALQTASSNQARFDHNPTTGESLGLLIEEQRTNLVTYSSDFSNAAWSKTNATVTSAANIAPDGTLTAQKLIADTTATAQHRINQTPTSSAGAQTFTVYAKAGEYSGLWLRISGTGGYYNLLNGTNSYDVGASGSCTLVGNGWYRCVLTVAAALANDIARINVVQTYLGSDFTGNGYSGIYIWGSQLEAGAFATSYIPTVASQVTRSADSASMTGTNFSSWYNQGQGTLYSQATVSATGSGAGGSDIVGITNSAGTGLEIYRASSGTGVSGYVGTGVASSANIVAGSIYKSAISYSPLTGSVVANGGTVASITPATYSSVSGATALGIMKNVGVANPLTGWISKISYYPKALTSAELQGLTG